ncbi:BgTH12-00297 [Blumeria graminis f. sp. triticale]|nr:BgTH12-00297 [Blumeria graminis f. sp. triticale]
MLRKNQRHAGYQCLSSQVNIRDIKSTMKSACNKLKQRKNKKGFLLFLIKVFKATVTSKPFPETEKFGFPKDAQMDLMPESVPFIHSYNYVVFSPSKCEFLGMVREKTDSGKVSYTSCEKTTWPLDWLEVMDSRSREGYEMEDLEEDCLQNYEFSRVLR